MERAAALLLALLLCSCAQEPEMPQRWQEQYDLGVRYLTDGNYSEAVIAFTAAIEIDPKRVEAYVGRGDAYVGDAAAQDESKAARRYEKAEKDYLYAIELDEEQADVYGKLADVYLTIGERQLAVEILERGVDATGKKRLADRLEELLAEEEAAAAQPEEQTAEPGYSPAFTANAVVFSNMDAYYGRFRVYLEQYGRQNCTIDVYGVRFDQPVVTQIDGAAVTVSEACLAVGTSDLRAEIESLADRPLTVTGRLYRNAQTEELAELRTANGGVYYNYRPNGEFVFLLESVN